MIAGSIALVVCAPRRRCAPSTGSTRCSRARRSSCSTTSCSSALCFVVFWGTFFPLISEAVTGDKASVGPPWFDRYTVPLALVLVLLSGIGPVIAWRRATRGQPAAQLRAARSPRGVATARRAASPLGVARQRRPALVMFAVARLRRRRASCQEFWRGARARRAMTRRGRAGRAASSLVRRNRRRYGGYIVHVGMARAVRRRRGVVGVPARARRRACGPGRATRVGGYDVTLRARRRRASTRAPAARAIDLGAVLDVSQGRQARRDAAPERGYYPSQDPTPRARRRASSRARRRARSACSAGLRRDVWTAVQPDIADAAADRSTQGDKVFARPTGDRLTPREARRRSSAEIARRRSSRRYADSPPPAHVPADRLAAGDLDLARRDRRLRSAA